MNIRDLTFLAALALGAIVFFVLAILGKVKIREYEVDLSPSMRGLSAILATVFFVIAVWLYMMPPKTPETAQTPTSTPSLPPTSKPASANSIGDCGDAEELGAMGANRRTWERR
ncbi:MAG: hypothetical protein M5R40_15390 [Anaerolineae bacterium]|nr:hypothetical protein [Anaerolineae bacterium]